MSGTRLDDLAKRCGASAWRLAYAVVGNVSDADDAVQQAFVVATERLETSRRDDPWPWFARVVMNVARRSRDRRGRRRETELDERAERAVAAGPTPLEAAVSAELSEMLREALDELPDDERDAIALTHLAGLTHREGAAILGMPPGTFSSHVKRGLDRLRARLKLSDRALLAAVAGWRPAEPDGGLTSAQLRWTTKAAPSGGASFLWPALAAIVVLGSVVVWNVWSAIEDAQASAPQGARVAALKGVEDPGEPGDPPNVDHGRDDDNPVGQSRKRADPGAEATSPQDTDDDPEPPTSPEEKVAKEAFFELTVTSATSGSPVTRFGVLSLPIPDDADVPPPITSVPYKFPTSFEDHPDGTTRLSLAPGRHRIVVVSPDHAPLVLGPLDVPATTKATAALRTGVQVTGRIRREGTDAPVHRANVAFQLEGTEFPGGVPTGSDLEAWSPFGADAYTDREGRYALPRLAPGRYQVRVFRPGLLTLRTSVTIGGDRDTYDGYLPLGGVATGIVRRADGSIAVNEMVRLDALDGKRTIASGWTDERGRFRITGIPPGRYRLEAGHGTEYTSFTVEVDHGKPVEQDIGPNLDGVRVLGTIRRRGTPVAGHSVAFISEKRADGLSESRWVETDDAGTFDVVVPAGTWRVHYDGTLKNGESLVAARGEGVVRFEGNLPAGRITGRLLMDGEGVAGAKLRLYTLRHRAQPLHQAVSRGGTTDDQGRIVFDGLRPGIYAVLVEAQNDHSVARSREVVLSQDGDEDVGDLVVRRAGGLRIRLVDERGNDLPVAGASVTVTTAAGEVLSLRHGRSDGRLGLAGIPPGTVAVAAHEGSRLRCAPATAEIVAGRITELTLTGRILPFLRLAITWESGGIVHEVGKVKVTRDGVEIPWRGSERLMQYFGVIEPGPIDVEIELPDGRVHRTTATVEGDGIVRIEVPK